MGPRRRRTALAVAATMLTLTAVAGCGALDKALDCVQTAEALTDSVGNLQQAISDAGNDPRQIDDALDGIDSELNKLQDKTDNADLSKAVDQLSDGVANVRAAVKDGDNSPDLTPVTDAATEIGKICTP
jgi:peptidoglycan hydrolase CwlO-like protein